MAQVNRSQSEISSDIVYITLEELFWSLYREDMDIAELREKIADVFSQDLMELMDVSVQFFVDEFKNRKNSSKENDDKYVKDTITKLSKAICDTNNKLINESLFE
jgi:hypothetical protein